MTPLPPGTMLGVVGGGQLGRMFVTAAQRLGYRVAVLAREEHSAAGQLADVECVGVQEDPATVVRFAKSVEALTCENELVPWECLAAADEVTRVRPGPHAMRMAQDRIVQRRFLTAHSLPFSSCVAVATPGDLQGVATTLSFPVCLKTARTGYDGRGQQWANGVNELATAWASLAHAAILVEEKVGIAIEFSIILARAEHGEIVLYEPIENVHRGGILDTSVCPSRISHETALAARVIAEQIARALELVGVLCVEFFLTTTGGVLVNEFAVRPHNSGHLTIEGCETSQFEQQVRALVGLPLGAPDLISPTAMTNLIGVSQPSPEGIVLPPTTTLHWYGKEPRRGRKVGHVTARAGDTRAALRAAIDGREALTSDAEVA